MRRTVDAAAGLGSVDVLVNNGQGLHVPLDRVDLDDVRAVLELNVLAPLAAMQAVLPAMRAQRGGTIVDVSSGTSRIVLPGVGAYAATTSALTMLSEVARAEWAADGVTVSTVYLHAHRHRPRQPAGRRRPAAGARRSAPAAQRRAGRGRDRRADRERRARAGAGPSPA